MKDPPIACPVLAFTVAVTAPAALELVVHFKDVAGFSVMSVQAAVVPEPLAAARVTLLAPVRLVPVMVMRVPPLAVPEFGEMLVMVGRSGVRRQRMARP